MDGIQVHFLHLRKNQPGIPNQLLGVWKSTSLGFLGTIRIFAEDFEVQQVVFLNELFLESDCE